MLLCKIGTSVAGGFVDADGNSDYLTELGRCVIRTDSSAPRSPNTQIQGVASSLIGSFALCDACLAAGITRTDGQPISPQDPGREVEELIVSGGQQAEIAKGVVIEMGENIVQLLLECEQHLPPIENIFVRGGLVGKHTVGSLLRSAILSNLPEAIAGKIVEEAPSQYSGAFTAAWLAAHGRRP